MTDPLTEALTDRIMVVCGICGNKRCPHASDPDMLCSGSNDVGQVGVRMKAPSGEPDSDEADYLLRALGLDPAQYRTDGGALNLPKIKAAIKHPKDYPSSETQTRFPLTAPGSIALTGKVSSEPRGEPVAWIEGPDGEGNHWLHFGKRATFNIGRSGVAITEAKKALATPPARPPAAEPIDMVLHCPACGEQHIDAPDWKNDPQLGAVRLSNAEQGTDAAGNREAQQQDDAPVSLLLRERGLASGGHAEQSLQDMRLPADALREGHEDLHVVRAGNGRIAVLRRQPDGQSSATVQGLPQGKDGCLEDRESQSCQGGPAASSESQSCEASLRSDAGGIHGAAGSLRWPLRDMRQAGAAEATARSPVVGSLPRNGQHQGGALLAMQHDVGVRERRSGVVAQRDQVSGKAPLRAPAHRSHLCRPEDGGCGHIWRPADVPTNGVAAVKTKGKADSPTVTPRAVESREQSALTDEQCDAIANELSAWAVAYDTEKYGLPLHWRGDVRRAREIIRAALATCECPTGFTTPLRATQPVASAAEVLTNEQIDAIALDSVYSGDATIPYRSGWCEDIGRPFARAIIAALQKGPSHE